MIRAQVCVWSSVMGNAVSFVEGVDTGSILDDVALLIKALRPGAVVTLCEFDTGLGGWRYEVRSKHDRQREAARVKREAGLATKNPAAYATSARLAASLNDQTNGGE